MWFCRHIIPTLGVLLTFGAGYFRKPSFLTPTQKQLLHQVLRENPTNLRQIFGQPNALHLYHLKMLCALKPLLNPEDIKNLPECSKALQANYPGIQELCKALEKPSSKCIMNFLKQPIQNQVDVIQRLNQLEAALTAYMWMQTHPNQLKYSTIKEFRALLS